MAVHPTDQNFTIGGTQDNGTEAQQTTPGNWTSAEGGDGGFALIDQSATDTGANLKAMYHTFFNLTNSLIGFDRAELGSCLLVKNSWEFRGVYPGQVGDPSPSCDGTAFDAPNGLVLADTVLFYAPMALAFVGALRQRAQDLVALRSADLAAELLQRMVEDAVAENIVPRIGEKPEARLNMRAHRRAFRPRRYDDDCQPEPLDRWRGSLCHRHLADE